MRMEIRIETYNNRVEFGGINLENPLWRKDTPVS